MYLNVTKLLLCIKLSSWDAKEYANSKQLTKPQGNHEFMYMSNNVLPQVFFYM